ncbi:MAG: hypothetical protein NTZ05_00240 [Chloroflexi bacterium]|nr:hypothetical protein [Chloroflexota bacterium]
MTYELWSKTSRNIIAAFETERGALAAVRQTIETNGRAYAETLAIMREDSRGRSKPDRQDGVSRRRGAVARIGASAE